MQQRCDRVYRAKCSYVEWSSHEPEEGKFVFKGQQDIVHFLKLAQKHGFLVFLRPGPYICAERDLGGFPYWLLSKNASIGLRSRDPAYLEYVKRYFSKLLPLLRPLLYANGGPIVAVQVYVAVCCFLQIENEYGSFKQTYGSYGTCDSSYTTRLRDLVRCHLGNDLILYTTDGPSDEQVRCGKVDDVFTTVDFGTELKIEDAEKAFETLRRYQERGPLVNTEFYTGWFDHWAQEHHTIDTKNVVRHLDKMLSMNASVFLYMFHGGTSFGYKAGALDDGKHGFQPIITSYDYDAPMTEAGDPTDKFIAIRNVISKYVAVPSTPVPKPKKKMALGKIKLERLYNVTDIRNIYAHVTVQSEKPLSFEKIKQSQALVLYDTWVSFLPRNPAVLRVPGLRDRGYIYVDDVYQGIISRTDKVYDIMIPVTKGQRLTVLVESQGRVTYGNLTDPKGIISDVNLSGKKLTRWNMTRIDETGHLGGSHRPVSTTRRKTSERGAFAPGLAVYEARFQLRKSPVLDTFIRLDHWKKGAVILNGFNLGRYWTPMGPQKTLYVPAVLFKPNNILNVIELEQAPCSEGSGNCFVEFVDKPEINAAVP
ncbi:hypothetical protein V5799_009057 [Amblyomma americanum]|uniref:Beta-galactosidase n=1 Tax=Amblyomma americanum TaxID=6943 RepID=A0AAQ4FC62_AMBAM